MTDRPVRWIRRSRLDWRWTLRADLPDSDVSAVTEPDWSQTIAKPGVCVVKTTPRRAVIRMPAVDLEGAIYCKQFTAAGAADWFRSLLRGSPARWEASRISLAEARRLPTAQLLGYGERISWSGVFESRLLTRSIDDVVPLGSWCSATELPEVNLGDSPPNRECWLGAAADLLAVLHGRGMWHGDLHAGNILLRREGDAWQGWLIDLAALRGSRRTPVRHIAENLARFLLSIERLSSVEDRYELIRRYWRALREIDPSLAHQVGSDADRASANLFERSARIVEPIHRKADRVWLRGNSKVQIAERGRYLAGLGEPWWREFVAQIDAWSMSAGAPAAIESRRVVQWTRFGERTLRLIRFPKSGAARSASNAQTAWEVGHALHRRACPVAVPWGYLERADADYLAACEPLGSLPVTERHRFSPLDHTPMETIRRVAQLIEKHGFVVDQTANDAVRYSADGEWCGWCALEAIRRGHNP